MPRISLTPLRQPTRYLSLELIPKGTWYVNVRTKFSKKHWDIIRRHVYAQAGYKCEICGGAGPKWPVECHEKWEWDEKNLVQRLVGFIALCPNCHAIKHVGHARATLSKTRLQKLYRHQRVVNKWRKAKQAAHLARMANQQKRRNALKWTVNITYARKLIYDLTGEVPR